MTNKTTIEQIPTSTPDITADRLAALRDLIPEAFTEGKVDFDKLRAALGDVVDDRPERYSFTWAGKRDAIRLLQTPSSATLVPAPEESVNWDTTQHLFIEGDNLEVLKLLYKAYFGKVKLIYIDPPYNTGNDFVYPDDFADPLGRYLAITGQKDAAGNLLTSNPETSGRYHSAWLNMMYPRLFMARQLLRDDGVLAVSIDDNELSNLRLLLNEVFGEENFLTTIIIQSNKRGQTYKQISKTHEYILIFFRTENGELSELEKEGDKDDLNLEDELGRFNIRELRNRNPKFGRFNRPNLFFPIHVNPTIVDSLGFSPVSIHSASGYSVQVLPLNSEGKESCWRWGKTLVEKNTGMPTTRSNLVARRKGSGEFGIYEKYRKSTYKAKSIWDETEVITEKGSVELRRLGLADYFDFPKPVFLLKKLLMLATDDGDIVLDFFGGSATIAQALLELDEEDGKNRQFILVQLPEPVIDESKDKVSEYHSIADVGKERIRRVIAERRRVQVRNEDDVGGSEPDFGFRVFKLAPSTIRGWRGTADPTPGDYVAQMDLLREPLVAGWRPEDVVWEVAIKEGFPLTSRVTTAAAAGQLVYRVEDADTGRAFHVCLDDTVSADVVAALGLDQSDLLVVRDSAVDDTAAANLALQCRLKTL